jgi:hypothetical protein
MNELTQKRRISWPIIAFFALVGALLAVSIVTGRAEVAAGLGIVAALVTWLIVVNRHSIANAKRNRDKGGPFGTFRPHGEQPPANFQYRLAHYLHCDEACLNQPHPPYESKMTFWSLVDFHRWFGPKPAWLMRRMLERIRACVHGTSRR